MLGTQTRYIDLKVDWSFKRIFGTEANRDLLISFLNEIFKGRKNIQHLEYNKNEHQGDNKTHAKAIFDVLCTGDKGEKFIIEVQNSPAVNFKKRAVYYTSKLVSEQAVKGEAEHWQYNITEVYLVAILDAESEISLDKSRYLHDIVLSYRDSTEIFYEDLGYIFVDLVNFVKKEEDCVNDLDEWLYWLKHLPETNELPQHLESTVFEKLFKLAEYSNLTPEDQDMYDQDLKIKWDNAAAEAWIIKNSERKGLEQGITKGIEQGIKQGIEQGIKQGIEQGLEQGIEQERKESRKKALQVAKNLKELSTPIEVIAKATGLSIEEIENL